MQNSLIAQRIHANCSQSHQFEIHLTDRGLKGLRDAIYPAGTDRAGQAYPLPRDLVGVKLEIQGQAIHIGTARTPPTPNSGIYGAAYSTISIGYTDEQKSQQAAQADLESNALNQWRAIAPTGANVILVGTWCMDGSPPRLAAPFNPLGKSWSVAGTLDSQSAAYQTIFATANVGTALMTAYNDNSILLVDAVTGQTLRSTTVGTAYLGDYSPRYNCFYVGLDGTQAVLAVDAQTGSIVANLDTSEIAPGQVRDTIYLPDLGQVVSLVSPGKLVFMEAQTLTMLDVLDLSAHYTDLRGLAYHEASGRLFFGAPSQQVCVVLEGATRQVLTDFSVPGNAHDIQVDGVNASLLICRIAAGAVDAYDLQTYASKWSVPATMPVRTTYSPQADAVVITGWSMPEALVVDAKTGALQATLPLQHDGGHAYRTSFNPVTGQYWVTAISSVAENITRLDFA